MLRAALCSPMECVFPDMLHFNRAHFRFNVVCFIKVAFAKKMLHADIIMDLATLTGAQGVATGRTHAALLTNDETWERACVEAGRASGDLVHPLIYCPELHFGEFASTMADMKNSTAVSWRGKS